ncbi:hypothetical protein CFREI_08350 [Corynebacterium freiburgense]|nr:hypothetical protein CFREI_08350 [Corynebacterium freiburgense]
MEGVAKFVCIVDAFYKVKVVEVLVSLLRREEYSALSGLG